jgi:hypothetical protein
MGAAPTTEKSACHQPIVDTRTESAAVDQKEMDTAKSRYKDMRQRVDAERKGAKKAVAPASKAKRGK